MGPGGVSLGRLSGVGQLRGRGLNTYKLRIARGNGSHGDTYRCTASNGASIETRSYVISGEINYCVSCDSVCWSCDNIVYLNYRGSCIM